MGSIFKRLSYINIENESYNDKKLFPVRNTKVCDT